MKRLSKILITSFAAVGLAFIPGKSSAVQAQTDTIKWKLQTSTALHETSSNWEFLVGDYNGDGIKDLYAIEKSGSTGSGHVEVHVLNGADNFQTYLLHQDTNLGLDERWTFQLGDYDRDGKLDLYSIYRASSNDYKSEIHILSGASNFTNFILHKQMPLSQTQKGWKFAVGDGDRDGIPDLYGIQIADTSTNKTEIHCMSGKSGYTQMLIECATSLSLVGDNWDFGISDFDGDNNPDLYCVAKSLTGSKKTEIHVLSCASGYKNYILQIPTLLSEVDSNQFDIIVGSGRLNLVAIKKYGTGSKTTEVHWQGYDDQSPLDVKRQTVVNEAKKYLGVPYSWGGTTPAGFDCSGFTQYVYKHALGIDISRTTYTQVDQGIAVSASDLKPGDLIFPNDGHVQLYIGNGQVIHAPHKGDVVRIANLGKVWRARRIIY